MFTGLNESFITICGYFIKSIKQTTTSNITMKTWGDVEIMVTYGTIGLVLALFVGAWCNLLSLQDKTAKNLGLHVTSSSYYFCYCSTLSCSINSDCRCYCFCRITRSAHFKAISRFRS